MKMNDKKDLKTAMKDEAYHRKQMEYYQEVIKIIKRREARQKRGMKCQQVF